MGGGGVGAAVCVRVRLPAPAGSHYSIAAGERSEPAGGQPCEEKRASKRSNARVRSRPVSPVCMVRPSTLSGVRPPWGRGWMRLPCPRVRPWLTRGYRVVRPLRGRHSRLSVCRTSPSVWMRLSAPQGSHCSVAADGAAGEGEAAGPAEGALLCDRVRATCRSGGGAV